MSMWNRASFRPGQTPSYDALKEGEPAADQEVEGGRQDDGRGDAIADMAPKPQPGDELYDTIHQGRSESIDQANAAGQTPNSTYDTLAAVALYAQTQEQEPQAEEGRGYDTLQGMKAQQAAADIEPQPQSRSQEQDQGYDPMRSFVTPETTQEAEVEREQMQQQRSRSMGLSL